MDRNGISTPLFERDSGLTLKNKSSTSFFGSVRNTLHKVALGAKSAIDHARGEDARTEEVIILEAQPPRASIDTQASSASTVSSQKYRGANAPHSAVASLRQHLTTRKHIKRSSILGGTVPTTTDGRESFDDAEIVYSPSKEERGRTRARRFSNFMGSIRGQGKQRGSVRLASTSPDDWNQRDPLYKHPEPPTEPIDIPRPAPLPLRLDLPPMSGLMPSPFQSSDRGQSVDNLIGRNSTTAPLTPFRFPVLPDETCPTPSQCLPKHTTHELGLCRLPDQPTPMPGTNMAMEVNPFDDLDGVREPKAGIRKMRSLNDMLEGEHISDSSDESTRPLAPSSIIRKPSIADSIAPVSAQTELPERVACLQTLDVSHKDEGTCRQVNHDPAVIDTQPTRAGPPSPNRMTVLPLRLKARAPTSDSDWETASFSSELVPSAERRHEQRGSVATNASAELREALRSARSWAESTVNARAGVCTPAQSTRVTSEDSVYFGSTGELSGSDVSLAPGVSVREYCIIGPGIQQQTSMSTKTRSSTSDAGGKEALSAPGVTAREQRTTGGGARQPTPILVNPFEADPEDRRRAQTTDESTATTGVLSEDSIPVSPMMVQELFYDDDDADVPPMSTEREIHAGSDQTGWGEMWSEHSSDNDMAPERSQSGHTYLHDADANGRSTAIDSFSDQTRRGFVDGRSAYQGHDPTRDSGNDDPHGGENNDDYGSPQGGNEHHASNCAPFADNNGAATSSTQLSPLAKQFYNRVTQSPSRNNLLAASTMCHLPQWSDPVWNLALSPNTAASEPWHWPSRANRTVAQQPSLDSDVDTEPPILPPHLRRPSMTEYTHSATEIRGATPIPASLANELAERDNPALTCHAPVLQPPNPHDTFTPPDPHDSALATPDLGPVEGQGEMSRVPTPLSVPEGILLIRRDELRASDLTPTHQAGLAEQWEGFGSGKSRGQRSESLERVMRLPRAMRVQAESGGFDVDAGFKEQERENTRGIDTGMGGRQQGRRASGSDDWSVLAGLRQELRKKVPRKTKSAGSKVSLLSAAIEQAGIHDAVGQGDKGKVSGSGRITPLSARPGGGNRYAALAESSTGSNRAIVRPSSPAKLRGTGAGGQENEVERGFGTEGSEDSDY